MTKIYIPYPLYFSLIIFFKMRASSSPQGVFIGGVRTPSPGGSILSFKCFKMKVIPCWGCGNGADLNKHICSLKINYVVC